MIEHDAKAVLDEMRTSDVDEVPEGWHRRTYFEKEWGLQSAMTGIYLKKAFESGKLEKKKYRVKCGDAVKPVTHYRIIGK